MTKQFLNRKIQELRDMQKVHYDSTQPMDSYNTGMYNGMEFIISCITGEEPKYKDPFSTARNFKPITENNMERIK